VIARLRQEIDEALETEHTPRQVAWSFALGIFITALPTLGVGVLAFLVIAHLFASVSKVALFASVVVLNPVVKWGVYGSSFWLGTTLLGPVNGISPDELSLWAAPQVVTRLLVGNLILAILFTVVAYAIAYRLTVTYRRRNGDVGPIEKTLEAVSERLPDR
jgi:uncharacterized protein (DUF2062 family)